MLDLQKAAALAIVNIFETGRPQGEYGKVTLLENDPGHLTYGRSQTTLASGNLYLLIRDYCGNSDSQFGGEFKAYLDRLEDKDLSLDKDFAFRNLLREAGDDPIMQSVQDEFFDRAYWVPAIKSCEYIGVESALGTAVVYDSRIHGSWHRRRDETIAKYKSLAEIGEQGWIAKYVAVRDNWLRNHPNQLLRKTVYRMEAFRKLIDENRWELELPFAVRSFQITEDVLRGGAAETVRASAAEERLLSLRNPYLRGGDVREVQEKLLENGYQLDANGVFGPGTRDVVIKFQKDNDLQTDGMVGNATRASLGL